MIITKVIKNPASKHDMEITKISLSPSKLTEKLFKLDCYINNR